MEQVLVTFGIDWKLLLVNAINFGLLLAVLWYFLYGPLTRMLEERRQKVAQGVRDAQTAQERLSEIENARADMLAKAGKEADTIVSHARTSASAKEKEIVSAGEAAASALLNDAQVQAEELKRQAIEESKQEVAKLIVLGIEKAMQPVSPGASRGGK